MNVIEVIENVNSFIFLLGGFIQSILNLLTQYFVKLLFSTKSLIWTVIELQMFEFF